MGTKMGMTGESNVQADLQDLLTALPPGAMIPAGWVADRLEEENSSGAALPTTEPGVAAGPASWRERLWTAPPQTRIGVLELAEAVGRSKHWVYRHTARAAANRLPCRKLDGELVFMVGEVRDWLRDRETVDAGAR